METKNGYFTMSFQILSLGLMLNFNGKCSKIQKLAAEQGRKA